MMSFNSLQAGRGIQRKIYRRLLLTPITFQFPSSGKGHSKFLSEADNELTKFGFNSLQAGRGIQSHRAEVNLCGRPSNQCFNSLQAGRGIQRAAATDSKDEGSEFQFPSSGKGHSKTTIFRRILMRNVSIPFKREGAFKVEALEQREKALAKKFQFPSSGKGHSKSGSHTITSTLKLCFNSLQAGRGIQSERMIERTENVVVRVFQFPSSGKGHSKDAVACIDNTRFLFNAVSIPFKREGAFKVLQV